MQRKDFIKSCGIMCLGAFFSAEFLTSCAGNYYAVTKSDKNQLIVAKTEFTEVKDGKTKARKYVLIRTDKLAFPICLYKLNENTYSALLMECTHKSCELNPNGDFLICPCHGSEFNNLGKVQNPPADVDLRSFKTSHDNENIYVTLQ